MMHACTATGAFTARNSVGNSPQRQQRARPPATVHTGLPRLQRSAEALDATEDDVRPIIDDLVKAGRLYEWHVYIFREGSAGSGDSARVVPYTPLTVA